MLILFSFAAHGEAGVVAFTLGESNVKKNDLIEVGDTILTGKNGHVHIRFIDGALISMRPNSKLKVETYTYDPHNPENNKVKFFLETGVVRSVTGEAGKLNKKGFRMNTPISAIGIRGTDYTVHVSKDSTRVFVKSGGIGLAPIDNECMADGFGVCQSSRLVEVFAGDKYILEINNDDKEVQLIKLSTLLNAPEIRLKNDIGNDLLEGNDELPSLPSLNKTPDIAWANWSNYEHILNAYFIPMTPFFDPAWRIYTMNSIQGLFVSKDYPYIPKSGTLSFDLDRYQAFSLSNDRYELLKLSNPLFDINFTDKSFTTGFNIQNSSVNDRIAVSGSINSSGGLRYSDDNTLITGTLNKNLDQAGLLFEKQINDELKVLGGSAWFKK